MFHLQLKRIETAIAAGRLDEAFELLHNDSLREHRDGQRVTDLLIDKFVRRSKQHLKQWRFSDARSDAERAKRLAGNTSEVSELVNQITELESEQQSLHLAERESAQEARIQAQFGRFTLGQNLLPSGPTHSRLATEIERKRSVATDAVRQIEQAIASDDFSGGIAIVKSLGADIRRHRLVSEKIKAMIDPILENAYTDLQIGRLDRACKSLNGIATVSAEHSRLAELRACLDRCVRVNTLIGEAQYTEADRELALVGQIIEQCRWIPDVRLTLAELARHAASVRSGPLGLLEGSGDLEATHAADAKLGMPISPMVVAGTGLVNDSDRAAYVLRVDGLGAILLLGSDRVSIGSYSKSKQYDLPIQTEGPQVPLFIRRTGEDYFAESESEFQVNERPTSRCLLATGDAIGFGRRGRLKFRKSVPASGSAVLQLSGAGLAKREIRSVALMADSLLFSDRGGHFSISGCERPIVVFCGREGYAIKYAGSGGEVVQLDPDRSVLLGETRFTLNQVKLS